jgi:hypothetical protein
MNWFVAVYSGLLFFLFTPDILFRIAIDDNNYITTGIHSLLFMVILYLTYNIVWGFSMFLGLRPMHYQFNDPRIGEKLDDIFKNVFKN